MYIFEQENRTFDNQVFEDGSMIRGGRKITFNDCELKGDFRIHVDRDVEEIVFNRTAYDNIKIGYFKEEGILDGFKMDDCQGNRVQIFYSDYLPQLKVGNRRTKNLVLNNVRSYGAPYAPFPIIGADNPIIENCIGIDARGDLVNTFQINACLNPVLRKNVAGRTVSTTVGDGIGIILDWLKKDDDMATTDALVEDNICFGQRGTWSAGISNYKGIRSTIRRNTLVGNTYAQAFNMHDDFNSYDNVLKGNENDARFSNGATDNGYGSQFII